MWNSEGGIREKERDGAQPGPASTLRRRIPRKMAAERGWLPGAGGDKAGLAWAPRGDSGGHVTGVASGAST
jgi:hypothetical protein